MNCRLFTLYVKLAILPQSSSEFQTLMCWWMMGRGGVARVDRQADHKSAVIDIPSIFNLNGASRSSVCT